MVFILVLKKYHHYTFLKINDVIKESLSFIRIKYISLTHFHVRTYFWDTAVPCGPENSHNVVQLNPDEDKYYLLTPYPTLMQSLKKIFTRKHSRYRSKPKYRLTINRNILKIRYSTSH